MPDNSTGTKAGAPFRRFSGLRARFALMLVLALVPAVGVLAYGGHQLLESVRARAEGRALTLAQELGRDHEQVLSTVDGVLFALGRGVQAGADCQALARDTRNTMDSIIGIAVLDGEGGERCRSGTIDAALEAGNYRARARRGHEVAVRLLSRAGAEEAAGIPRVGVARGVAADGGSNESTLVVAEVRVPWLPKIKVGWNLPPEAVVTLALRDGTLFQRSMGETLRPAGDAAKALRQALRSRERGSVVTDASDGPGHVHGFAPLLRDPDKGAVASIAVGLPRTWVEALPRRLLWLVAAGLGVVLLLAGGLVWTFGSVLVLGPVRTLVRTTERLGSGDLSARCGPPYPSAELGQLARKFDSMAADLESRERQLERRTEALARSNAELQSFAYVASHDLQEPLRKVRAFGDMLADELGDDLSEDAAQYLWSMQNAGGRMESLIQDLLMFSRVQTRANPFAPTDLKAVAEGVVSDLSVRIEETGADVRIGDLPTIDADDGQMRQLIQNLITNALKFRRQDVTPVISIDAAPDPETPDHVRLTVADNGIGLDTRYRDKVFEVFQRLHERDQYEGTGMGLAICRKIVYRHYGSIDVSGTPGEGTTFTIVLPRHQEEQEGGHA